MADGNNRLILGHRRPPVKLIYGETVVSPARLILPPSTSLLLTLQTMAGPTFSLIWLEGEGYSPQINLITASVNWGGGDVYYIY